jgi:hypothetical protein
MKNPSLKDLRRLAGLTTRQVSQFSRQIAVETSNPSFALSCGWLTRLENHKVAPSVHNLASLSIIYGTTIHQLLCCCGIDVDALLLKQFSIQTPRTKLLQNLEPRDVGDFALAPHAGQSRNTNLMPTPISFGSISYPVIRSEYKRITYGLIGTSDFTLYPLVLPGSIVQIARDYKAVRHGLWRNEIERPIYFLELRDGYAYGWCELNDGYLTVLPHPQSPCTSRRFAHPIDIQIIGRVVAVTMFLTCPTAGGPNARTGNPFEKRTETAAHPIAPRVPSDS